MYGQCKYIIQCICILICAKHKILKDSKNSEDELGTLAPVCHTGCGIQGG